MSNSHDAEPDQAALDELMRAFADDEEAFDIDEIVIVEQDPLVDPPPAVDEPQPASPDAPTGRRPRRAPHDQPATVGGRADAPDRGEEGGEAAAGHGGGGDEAAESGAEPQTPSIIRIDDYAGSEELTPADAARAGASTVPISADDAAPPGAPEASPGADGGRGIISIDDEDLPDAVYVEGSLDRDGSRTIVFIEDDDTGNTLAPESERDVRRGIEPRLRERRLAVKRAQGRKRLRWFVLAAVLLFVGVGVLALLGSGLFAIQDDQVFVTPTRYTDQAQLDAVIDDLVGTPVLRADTQAAERDLEAIPWVDEAIVRTDFPNGVTIEIREREAMTTYQGPDGRFRVLDREGRVLDVIDGYPFAYLLVGGPDPVDLDPGEFAPQGYAAASELAKNLTGSVRVPGRIQMIEVTADGSRLSMHLDDGTEVRFGEARDFLAKLVRLETVLTSGEDLEPGVIDISTSEVTR